MTLKEVWRITNDDIEVYTCKDIAGDLERKNHYWFDSNGEVFHCNEMGFGRKLEPKEMNELFQKEVLEIHSTGKGLEVCVEI